MQVIMYVPLTVMIRSAMQYLCLAQSPQAQMLPYKPRRVLDVEFMERSDDKQFKPDNSQLMPSSSASLDLATDSTSPD